MKKKYLFSLILILLFTFCLASCGGSDGDDDGTDTGLALIEDGVAKFKFVIAKGTSADVRRLLERDVAGDLSDEFGIDVAVVNEGASTDEISECEVLIGNVTTRGEEYIIDGHDYGHDGYAILRMGNKVVINAGSDSALSVAVTEFRNSILGIENDDITDVVMRDEDSVTFIQSDYKITSLSLSGVDMRGYKILTDLTDEGHKAVAEKLRDDIYSKTGYYFPVTDGTDGEKSIIIKSIPKCSGDDSFRVFTDSGSLVVECAYDNMLEVALGRFTVNYITFGKGDINFDGEVYKEDISVVYYEDFGAVGNGKTDDFAAIYEAHEFANISGQTVRATAGKTYYIKNTRIGGVKTARIMTDTDWTGAKFIIDDTDVSVFKNDSGYGMGGAIFTVVSN